MMEVNAIRAPTNISYTRFEVITGEERLEETYTSRSDEKIIYITLMLDILIIPATFYAMI